ncbi:MAG: ABC transporter ATP-binding protein [Chloroflexi bacterium]|nr:ABC transporter ATP-binding protein [Chloroflexota bacterium]
MSQTVMAGSTCVLEARDLTAVLGGQKVLEIPLLQIYTNEVLVVIGPNGSGKTTLLLCLASLLKPSTGTVTYRGESIWDSASLLELRRRFAVVFQESLLLNGTVWDNVTLGLRLRGVKGDEIKVRAQKWLERFGIASLVKRQARTLSSGEAKRVSLARAFVLEPEVLFLDEPFNALDSPTRQALTEDFESVLRETEVTTVMVTHERNEALALADHVAVLMNGRIRQIGAPEVVFSSPVDGEVAGFVGAGNVLHGVVSSKINGLVSVDVSGQPLQAVAALDVGTRVTVYLHYEDITVSLPASMNVPSSARNQLKGRIIRIFPVDSQLKVTLDCGFTLAAVITRRSWDELGLEVGREVVASFKASSIHLIPKH